MEELREEVVVRESLTRKEAGEESVKWAGRNGRGMVGEQSDCAQSGG